ncbi:MAG: hypothetical protein JWO11_3659 [Nocardioides sp.]|nr:hypothetical protein [Nocardioides sp.]
MPGIATIDRRSVSNTIAVWVMSASDGIPGRNVNVVVDAATRPGAAHVASFREFAARADEHSPA